MRSNINYSLRSDINIESEFEILSIDIKKPNSKAFNVTGAYRPPSCVDGFFENLENIIRTIDIESKEIIILGDLNCNYLRDRGDSQLSLLKQLSTIYHLKQLINEPTRVTQTTSTLIDIVLSNEPSRIIASGVLHIGISDHSLVYAVRKFAIPSKNTHKYVTTRSFKNFNANAFKADLKSVPWDGIKVFKTPDEMIEVWQSLFLGVTERHAPMRTRRVRNKKSPWLSSELRDLINARDRLKRQAIITKDISIWDKYKQERNRVNNEIKKAKRSYYKSQIEKCIGNPKEIWKIINQITYRKTTSNCSISELKSGDESFTKPADISEVLNNHFASVGSNLASALPNGDNHFENYIEPAVSTFALQHTSTEVVLKHLEKLSPNKATGLDNISCRLLKEAAQIIAPSVALIINKTIDTGFFPSNWKLAKIFPLFKANDRTNVQNYRPISVLPAISKICERVVYDQLYSYLNSHGLLSKYQSGFRPLHSTVTALLDVTNQWYLNIDNSMINMVVFLDLAKAFDTVSHNILLKKLELYGVKGKSLDWFTSYLTNRQQQCVVEGCISKSQVVDCGVPQGSILGPLLFLIYINDLPGCLQHVKPHMYADDTILSAASTSTVELQDKINIDLSHIKNWLLANKLSLNVTKTEYIFFGTDFKLSNLGKVLPVMIGEKEIKRVETTKHLGVHLDENLKWNEHIDKLCAKVSRAVNGLKQARDYVPISILNIIYKSLIQPIFDYCDIVWGNLDKGLAIRIQKLQNRAARIITFQGYDIRSADILKQLGWETLVSRREKHLSLLMYDTVNKNVPTYLSDLFINCCENNPYKSRLRNTQNNLDINHLPKTEYFKGSFLYRGTKLWNSLPEECKTSKSKLIFKKSLSNIRQANC